MLVLPMLPMLRANSLAFTRSCVRTQGQTHRGEKHRELRMVSLPIRYGTCVLARKTRVLSQQRDACEIRDFSDIT